MINWLIGRCFHISNIAVTLLKTKPKVQACNQVFNHSTYLYHFFLCVTFIGSDILCPYDVFEAPVPSPPSSVPVASPVLSQPSPVCLPLLSPLALPTVLPATISQHLSVCAQCYVLLSNQIVMDVRWIIHLKGSIAAWWMIHRINLTCILKKC